jgi:DNA-binding response OmpR family regulator
MIVEDETLLALDMERTLLEKGHQVIGPFQTSAAALSALQNNLPDLALLDVNLGRGDDSLPVAKLLRDHAIPFAFLTGYAASRTRLGDDYPLAEKIAKPCSPALLIDTVQRLAH